MPRRNYRSRHRMRSHEAAHAGLDEKLAPPIFDHPMVPANEPHMIAEASGLAALIERLRAEESFAYDSEFIGEETYYPNLCVIQVATASEVSLIDALAFAPQSANSCDSDLRAFWELLADPGIEKIVHAGQQDLEPVVRYLDRGPANIFDVQVAAGFIGAPYPASLSRLINDLIGPEAAGSVGAKFSQWDRRPLTPVQMQYAANDVRYLPLLRQRIGERLEANKNITWASREFEELCDPALYRFDPKSPGSQRLRIRGVERLGPQQKAALRALLAWRDEQAREHDVPPRTLVKDGVLFEIARHLIAHPDAIRRVRGLPRPLKRAGGAQLADIVQGALDQHSGSPDDAPRIRRTSEEELARIDALWHAMRERCQQHSIDPALVTSKRELTSFVRARSSGSDRDLRLTRPGGWRAEFLADLLQ